MVCSEWRKVSTKFISLALSLFWFSLSLSLFSRARFILQNWRKSAHLQYRTSLLCLSFCALSPSLVSRISKFCKTGQTFRLISDGLSCENVEGWMFILWKRGRIMCKILIFLLYMNDKVHMRKTLLDTYFTILPLSVCSLFIKTMRRIMRKILILFLLWMTKYICVRHC
jgi:hypothetical protein